MRKGLLFSIFLFFFVISSARVMAAAAGLSSLTISNGTFSPAFTSGTLTYTVAESSSINSITFKPTQLNTGSTIKINGTTVTSGANTGSYTLVNGTNTYSIVVKNGANTTTYTVNVISEDINYAGSPFVYNAGTPIATASSTETGDNPTSYSGVLPAGLTLNTSTGDITGTPTASSAATNYTITASYGGGVTATTTVNIQVLAPSISYAGTPFTFYTGSAIATQSSTEVNGNPTTYAGTLPAGLTLNTSTGSITGTPTAVSAATNYTITATYSSGVTASTVVNINVQAPSISYAGSPYTIYAGSAITTLSATTTGGTPISYSGTVPAGLTLNTTTGDITGTPTTPLVATNYFITAHYSGVVTALATVNITVLSPSISYTGSPFTFYTGSSISTLSSTQIGGNPISYTGTLPAGLSLNAATGYITGTPTTVSAATNYTITAHYSGVITATAVLNIKVLAPTISYTGSPYIYTTGIAITPIVPTATGSPTGFSTTTALPPGLSIDPVTGIISGTPTATSTAAAYTIKATYAGGVTATTAITITVNPPAPIISYTPSTNVYTTGIAIATLTPTNTGGAAVSYSVSPGLPTGLSLNTATGVITGTPTVITAAANYTVTATNVGGIGTAIVRITVNPPAPVISYTPPTDVYVMTVAIPALTPVNTGGAATSYAISPGLPSGLSFSTSTGVISGTPLLVSLATTYTITATNLGGSGSTTVSLEVDLLAPSISYTPATNTYQVGIPITTLSPTVLTGNPTSYSINTALPAGLSFNTSTGAISGTPTALSSLTTYTITASNAGGSGNTTVKITVVNPPPPVISYSPSTNVYTVGTAITTLTPSNSGGAATGGYTINTALPAGLSFNTTTGAISGTPTAISTLTTYTVTATNAGGTGTTTVKITVNPPPPIISYSPATNIYVVGTTIPSLTPTNTGGAAVSYSASPTLPAGLSVNVATGVISGTPTTVTAAANYTITATNAGGSGSTTINLTVNPQPPVISYTPATNTYTVGTAITALTPTNSGGAAASYSISTALPAGLSFNTTTGVISGNPTVVSPATNYIITATNVTGSGSTTVNITVYPQPPAINYTPSTNTFTVGVPVTLTPNNTGGPSTDFIIGPSLPPGLSFNTATGVISGTPLAVSPTAITYTISADNDGGLGTTTITITCVNPAKPIISYSPSTNVYTVGTAISTLTPTNTGGAASSYAINTALPAGLSFNTSTGVISGTPTAVSAATTYTITATNVTGSGSTTVNLTVNPQGPAISYSPSTNVYTVGTPISSLTPTSTGGPVASYSISSALPAGLSFNTTTGVISGTPTAISAVTTYTITATNVTGTATATVTLSVTSTAPSITYNPGTDSYPVGNTITPLAPTNTGGAPTGYTISATLPSGLSFDTSTGIISGTPTTVFPTTTYTIKATNAKGSSSTNVIITINPKAPAISYSPSTNNYPLGPAITPLTPVNTGGGVSGFTYSSTGTTLTGASLAGPSLMTIDASGNIYVANYNNQTISKYNSSNVYQGTYTTGKTFTNPEGIVFDSMGNSYVEDTGAGAIYKFGPTGAYISTIVTGLNHPLGISIDPQDNLYIATYVYTSPYTSSVTKYSTSGVLLQTLSNTQMNESDGVAVDGSGNIFVLNRGNNLTGSNMGNVTEYNSAGTYVGVFSSGYNDPLAISTDANGNVFVADSHNNQVKIYSPNGVLLNTLSGFTDVEGFTADANGNLYVSDFTNNTVKEFSALGGYHISAPLPPGLSFNTTNGQITGTPTATFPATTYTVTAYNITGSGSTTVTLSCSNSYDWIGVTSTDWNTSSNWLSNLVPTSSSTALIGVNRTFNYFPNVLSTAGTVNVGAVQFGTVGSQAAGVVVNGSSTLNVVGAITYQSDASSGLGYTATLSGTGTINAASLGVIANTTLGSSYTEAMASSVNNLNVAGNISLTSGNSGAALFNAAFNVTGGTTLLSGIVQTSNTAASTSIFTVTPTTTATLQLANATALSGLSLTGTNTVTWNNNGATVQYSGAAQTVYSTAAITGLPNGVNYMNIVFSGTGIKTALSGNLNIAGNFTNSMANDASNYVNLSSPYTNFGGTTQNIYAGSNNGTTFYNLNFGGAGTKTIVSGQAYVATTGVLYMSGTNTSTILAANGLLTLNSDASGSASVAAIATSGPSITGVVNVQRYVTGGSGYRGYRLSSSPVYAGTANANKIYSINYLQNSMYLTGDAGGGFDKAGNPTLYTFREDLTPSNTSFTSGNFWGISKMNNTPTYNYYLNSGSTTYNLPVGNGYLFFFRGNRASASLAAETTASYTNPVAATLTAPGTLIQGQVTVHDWYTPTSAYLGYTGTGTGTNHNVRGFNLVGNPYASSIDWETYNTTATTSGIYVHNVGITAYELNPATDNYDIYQKGGIYTNHGRRIIVSGEGFFVLASNNSSPQIIFNETAKSTAQNTGLNLFMSTPGEIKTLTNADIDQHLRLQLAMDSVNTDDIYVGFNAAASEKYVEDEDAPYKVGNGKVSLTSYSADSIRLAINRMPLPGQNNAVIPLYVSATTKGLYSLNMTELEAIPQIYQVWLMDNYLKDSLDMRNNKTYAFNITTDTGSYGGKRFYLLLRQDPSLAIHLLSFTAEKAATGAQTAWVTQNEQNYSNFIVERSTDGGTTFNEIGGLTSSGIGKYFFLDKNPPVATDTYRLKVQDLNGNISYSRSVTLVYGNGSNIAQSTIMLYPNPTVSTINLKIKPALSAVQAISQTSGFVVSPDVSTYNTVYSVKIINSLGAVVKTTTTTQTDWQSNISNLLPGTYIIQVVNSTDNSLVGKGTFVKL